MAAIQIEIPPACEPVSLAMVKSQLNVCGADDDDLISLYLQAAREQIEVFLARSLINKGYRQSFDFFPYFTDTTQQMAYPPAFYSLPRYSTTLSSQMYTQMMKLSYSRLVRVDRISYLSSEDSVRHDLLPAPFAWEPGIEYAVGDQREDSNGNLQEVVEAAGDCLSGSAAPAWATTEGATTTDYSLVWECQGSAPTGGFVYDADSEPPRVFPLPGQNWPSVLYVSNAVQIHYTAGYGDDPKDVPGLAKVGIVQTVASWYANREPVSSAQMREIPGHLQDFLWSLRVLDLAPTRG